MLVVLDIYVRLLRKRDLDGVRTNVRAHSCWMLDAGSSAQRYEEYN
jgi:hypothetical protein